MHVGFLIGLEVVNREGEPLGTVAEMIYTGPIDAFFDQVTVNDADPAKRQFRLSLLARLRDAQLAAPAPFSA